MFNSIVLPRSDACPSGSPVVQSPPSGGGCKSSFTSTSFYDFASVGESMSASLGVGASYGAFSFS